MNIQDMKIARGVIFKHLDDSWELAFNSKLTARGSVIYTEEDSQRAKG